jgi:hypothetical protein
MAKARKAKARPVRKIRVLLLTRADGEIIGGALRDDAQGSGVVAEIRPLPGQALHEVELDERLVRGKSAQDLYAALSVYRVEPAQSRLVPRRREGAIRAARRGAVSR